MKGRVASWLRWWFLPPLLTIVLSVAGGFLFAVQEEVFFYVLLGLCCLLLLLQLVLLLCALFSRKWWHVLGILVGGAVSAVMVFLSLVVLLLAEGMDNAHSQKDAIACYHFDEGHVNCHIEAATPDSAISLAVGEWLDDELGGYYTGDDADMQAIVDFYGDALCDTLRQAQEEDDSLDVEFEAEMLKAYETPQFVTYTLSTCTGLGGAHPLSAEKGATFRKSDGRRITWDIIRQSMTYAFNDLLVEMLCNYFGAKDGTELSDMLVSCDVYNMPLPSTPPYFLENGAVVIYQQYEIAAYAAGMPNDTIPYERIKPFMTEWSKKLISNSSDNPYKSDSLK